MNIVDEFLSQFELETPEGTPGEIARQYTFLSCLSNKETRAIYLLRHKETGEKAVLKISDETDLENLERSYLILSRLEHPGIPKTLGYWSSENKQFLLRAWAEGETLATLVSRDGVFTQRMVLEIIQSLCEILSYLHRQDPPVVFRDIKPQNIVLTPNGKLSLIDFGIIKEVTGEDDGQTASVGSKGFASPENYGFSETGPRTDIYAIGNLMLWLATGSTEKKAREQIEKGSFLRIIDKCTELSQRLRFRSVDALSRCISRVLYPPKLQEMTVGFCIAALILTFGVLWSNNAFVDNTAEPPGENQVVVGRGYEKEAAFPIDVHITKDGTPFADCVVSIDNRHWYYPNEQGKAQLWTYAYDFYSLRVASENRMAVIPTTVNRGTSLDFAVDFDRVPTSEEWTSLHTNAGETRSFPLDVRGAVELNLQGEPEGVSVLQENGGLLLLAEDSLAPGFYSFFFEAKNEFGLSTTAVSLFVEAKQPVIPISSAQQLFNIRENPSGYYELAADIDLSGYPDWQPIGNLEQPFTGKLDGAGHRISGLTIQSGSAHTGLFGIAQGAVFQNIVFKDPVIQVETDEYSNIGVLAGMLQNCLVENCAVFGGQVNAACGSESNIGGLFGYGGGVFLGCFNSANVQNTFPDEGAQSYTGGICGVLLGYMADSGNTGNISGIYVSGGLVGMNDNSVITRSYNAGQVRGAMANTHIPPGGVAHIMRVGRYISNCVFEETVAEIGVSVTTNGYPYRLRAIEASALRNVEELAVLLISPEPFHYASLDSGYPIPAGIFREQADAPALPQSGPAIDISAKENVRYFYTIDGTNPYLSGPEGVDSVHITLNAGQTIQIFSAEKGKYDSPVVSYKAR